MNVEFIGRFKDNQPKTIEELDEDRIQEIINPDYVKVKYAYRPFVVEIFNIDEHIMEDDEHTTLKMISGNTYVIKLPYEHYIQVYQQITGKAIQKVQIVTHEVE